MPSEHSPRHIGGMTQEEFTAAVADRILPVMYAALKLELMKITRTCMNCEHWLEGSAVCGHQNHLNLLPPPHIIANGCDDHEEKAPF
jgi:hypothetical protein